MIPFPGQRVRVRSCCKLCPGRVGTVLHRFPGANPTLAAARGGRWVVGLDRVHPKKDRSPRLEWLWGEELEPEESQETSAMNLPAIPHRKGQPVLDAARPALERHPLRSSRARHELRQGE
jgi:hypothetical protein